MKKTINLESVGLQPLQLLGSGSDGIVVKAVNFNTQKVYAVKVMSITKGRGKLFEKEAMNTIRLSPHPNIVQVKGYHKLTQEHGIIVMEKMHCDLMSYFLSRPQMSERKIKKLFKMMCEAVTQCHENKIAHLDIKPENFLLDKSKKTIKLCDFHRSVDWANEETNFDVNTYYNATSVKYRPPEANEPNIRKELSKVDVWCLGVCLFGILFGFFPFHLKHDGADQLNYDMNQLARYLDSSELSDDSKDLISFLLRKDPEERPSMELVLSHPYFL